GRQESDAEAARLLAAAGAHRERIGAAPRPLHDLVAILREALGDGFETAWDEGAVMSIDDAMAYAARGRGERKRPSTGWASLTPLEQQVVGLVAEGLTNPQIAERLFIATGTVKVHVRHIFEKPGVSTRS